MIQDYYDSNDIDPINPTKHHLAPEKDSELRSFGREVVDKLSGGIQAALGGLIGIAGLLFIFLGIGSRKFGYLTPIGGIVFVVGIAVFIFGMRKIHKAQFIAWSRDAIERDRHHNSVQKMQCPKCKNYLPAKTKFCSHCGTILMKTCKKCNAPFSANSKFCSECGEPLNNKNILDHKETNIGNKIKSFVKELEKIEKWHATEYSHSARSGFNSFSSAKGNYRWIRQYAQNIRKHANSTKNDSNSFFSIAMDLLD